MRHLNIIVSVRDIFDCKLFSEPFLFISGTFLSLIFLITSNPPDHLHCLYNCGKAQHRPPSVQAEIVMLMMNEVGVVDVENENDVDNYDVVDVGDKGSASATGS